MKDLFAWIRGELNYEFYLETPILEISIPFPFWKVVVLAECVVLFFVLREVLK